MRLFDELGLFELLALVHHVEYLWVDVSKGTSFAYLFGTPVLFSHIFPILQPRENFLHCSFLLFQFLHLQTLSTPPGLLLQTVQGLLYEFSVFDSKFFAYDIEVSNRVDITLDVDDLGVVEASHDLEDGVHSTDMREESVT